LGSFLDAGHSRVMSELAGFAGLAMRMISDAKTLKEAVEQQETLTREMSPPHEKSAHDYEQHCFHDGPTAVTPKEMTNSVLGRLNALAQAHALIRRTAEVQERKGDFESAIGTIPASL
jgi:putative heme degradation protein